jgi:hypothetical protein
VVRVEPHGFFELILCLRRQRGLAEEARFLRQASVRAAEEVVGLGALRRRCHRLLQHLGGVFVVVFLHQCAALIDERRLRSQRQGNGNKKSHNGASHAT